MAHRLAEALTRAVPPGGLAAPLRTTDLPVLRHRGPDAGGRGAPRLVTAAGGPATRVRRHGPRGRSQQSSPAPTAPATASQGAPVSLDVFARMLREAALRHREPDDRAWRSSSTSSTIAGRPALKSGRGARGQHRQPAASRPSSRSSTSRSTCSRGGWAPAASPGSRTTCAPASTDAEAKANEVHAHMVMIGILPTLEDGPPDPRARSAPTRATSCSQRPGPRRPRRGPRHRHPMAPTGSGRPRTRSCRRRPAPAPSCTPRSGPDNFAAYWNASQAISGIQLADRAPTRRTSSARSCGGRPGSPSSSRPPTPGARSSRSRASGRGSGSANAGSPPSSTCSRRTSATSRRCCPVCRRRGPARGPRERRHPGPLRSSSSTTAPSTAGTARSTTSSTACPHLRVENRVLAAGPTVIDTMANAAFYFGLARVPRRGATGRSGRGCRSPPPRRTSTSAAQHGIDARVYWPGSRRRRGHRAGAAPAAPAGPRGPAPRGVSRPTRPTRLLSVIEQRCILHRNGATWYVERVTAHEDTAGATRAEALRLTLQEYRELMHANEPVHTWPL